jgi:hypothetical protein
MLILPLFLFFRMAIQRAVAPFAGGPERVDASWWSCDITLNSRIERRRARAMGKCFVVLAKLSVTKFWERRPHGQPGVGVAWPVPVGLLFAPQMDNHEPIALADDIFRISFEDQAQELDSRFAKSLDACLVNGIAQWRRTLV